MPGGQVPSEPANVWSGKNGLPDILADTIGAAGKLPGTAPLGSPMNAWPAGSADTTAEAEADSAGLAVRLAAALTPGWSRTGTCGAD